MCARESTVMHVELPRIASHNCGEKRMAIERIECALGSRWNNTKKHQVMILNVFFLCAMTKWTCACSCVWIILLNTAISVFMLNHKIRATNDEFFFGLVFLHFVQKKKSERRACQTECRWSTKPPNAKHQEWEWKGTFNSKTNRNSCDTFFN